MTEFAKRFYTSIFLIIALMLSIFNQIILTSFLILCFFQMFFEFYFMLKKILFNKKKLLLLILFIILLLLSYISLYVWLSFLDSQNDDQIYLLFIIIVAISSDIGGYLFGKTFKGKKISKISPNKTYSGMFGSYILSIVISLIIFKNFLNFYELIILSIIISTFSQIGDLLVSFIKRKAKLKDTGKILPGHGGLLDRFDSLILSIPVGSLMVMII
tara:strand:+ start:2403 stop:3047 length:645 start_codon:yes stop_codon:yes gene_type:complete